MNLGLSKRGDYVARSAICLADAYESDAPKKLRQVSAEMGVPRTFVSQILGDLVRAGLAVSSLGKEGGYRLARPPDEISLLEVVEAGEGSLAPVTCSLGDGPCRLEAVCPVHDSLDAASAAFREELAATSLADLAGRSLPIEAASDPASTGSRRRAALAVPVADSVQVELASSAIAARLRAGGSWLASHVEAASADGLATRVRVGPGGPAWLGKTVAVQLGEPEGTDEALVIPITWKATGPAGLFPRLEAELRLSALDPERAELALSGRYLPPLGRAGQVLDDTLLTRVARATIRSFLRRVARALEEEAAGHQAASPAGGPADQ